MWDAMWNRDKTTFCNKHCKHIKLSSTTNHIIWKYKESVHPTGVQMKPNTPTHDVTGKEWTHGNWMALAIILPFHNLPMRKQYRFMILTEELLLWQHRYLNLCWLTVTPDIQEDDGGIWKNLIQLSDLQHDEEIYSRVWYTETTQQDLLQHTKMKEQDIKSSWVLAPLQTVKTLDMGQN